MDSFAVFVPSESAAAPPLAAAVAELRELIADLGGMTAPNEAAFLDAGNALARAHALFGSLDGAFSAFLACMRSDATEHAAAVLKETLVHGATLSSDVSTIGDCLTEIGRGACAAMVPMATLSKIVAEVVILAINAKIQAAQVPSGAIDFSVFTTEIGRMGELAVAAVRQGNQRLQALRDTMAEAVALQSQSAAMGDEEIQLVRSRGEFRLKELARRQDRSGTAFGEFAAARDAIAAEIAACIGRLQINDMTSQRLEHCRQALQLVCALMAGGGGEELSWAAELDEPRRRALAATVCRLQARQLGRAADEFTGAVDDLRTRLRRLSGEAAAAKARAADVLGETPGVNAGETRATVQASADRVRGIISTGIESGQRVRGLVGTVAVLLEQTTSDMNSIRSIDTDLRLMGLNASLKCARLGSAGRSLAVVAQELRTCSQRTDEALNTISGTIGTIRTATETLEHRAEDRYRLMMELAASVEQCINAVMVISGDIDEALAPIWRTCDEATELLADTAAGITLHDRMHAGCASVVARLASIADSLGADPAVSEAISADIQRLLERNYTMASERAVHKLFADGDADASPPAQAPTKVPVAADDDVDAFFF